MIWTKFTNVINGLAQDIFHQGNLTWMRLTEGIDQHGESEAFTYQTINLKCLMGYNDFRTWPTDKVTEAGIVDTQSLYVILNKKYLEDNGYLTADFQFAFKPNKDYFIHEGVEYEDSGNTSVAQAADKPLLYYLILKRREARTGEPLY